MTTNQIHYINLTNGIEALLNIKQDVRYIRIQSTACEQKRWDFIIQDLDNDFYMELALGNTCLVYDFGARKNRSRAIYQGIEFIKYVLNKRWFSYDYIPIINRDTTYTYNCTQYFCDCYAHLEQRTIKKVDYFKRFLQTDKIELLTICQSTLHDGDMKYYCNILERMMENDDVKRDCQQIERAAIPR